MRVWPLIVQEAEEVDVKGGRDVIEMKRIGVAGTRVYRVNASIDASCPGDGGLIVSAATMPDTAGSVDVHMSTAVAVEGAGLVLVVMLTLLAGDASEN